MGQSSMSCAPRLACLESLESGICDGASGRSSCIPRPARLGSGVCNDVGRAKFNALQDFPKTPCRHSNRTCQNHAQRQIFEFVKPFETKDFVKG